MASSALASLRQAQEERWLNRDRRLIFHPPQMINPWVINAPAGRVKFPHGTDDASVSYLASDGNFYFNHDQDVVIFLKTSETITTQPGAVLGGRHVRVIGGKFTRDAGSAANNILSVFTQSGSAWIEGFHADVAGGNCDGITCRWNQTIATNAGLSRTTHPGITIQHCRIENIGGIAEGVHGDAYQSQAVVDVVRIEEFTFSSDYQGTFVLSGTPESGPVKGLWMRRINSHHVDVGAAGYVLSYYFLNGNGSPTSALYPVHLSMVYAGDNPAPFDDWKSVATIPNDSHTWGPTLATDSQGDYLDFSALGLQITGRVRRGQPPGGDFVSAASTGLTYRSPWPVP